MIKTWSWANREDFMATRALTLYDATIGKKAVMALSGVVMLGFVFGHAAGNY